MVEAREMAFAKNGRSTQVTIVSEKEIDWGAFGTAYQANIVVGNRRRDMVIKIFHPREVVGKTRATLAVENYLEAKKAELKVFTTYRLGADGQSILMTNGNTESTFCVGSGINPVEPSAEDFCDHKIASLADKLLDQALKATQASITVNYDAYFLLINRCTRDSDIVLGDLDHVTKRDEMPDLFLLTFNLTCARMALQNFMTDCPEKFTRYTAIMDAKIQQLTNCTEFCTIFP